MMATGLLAAACGSGGSDGGSSAPTTAPAANESTPSTDTDGPADTDDTADTAEATDTTDGSGTGEPPRTSVPEQPWSDIAPVALAALQSAQLGGSDVGELFTGLFGQPAEIPWPSDAVVSGVRVSKDRNDDGTAAIDWRFTVATAMSPADLEVLAVEGFADGRWEPGARVESTLDSGVFVTLNYPATTAADAEGWGTLAITVGPETEFGSATGRNEMEVSVELQLPSIDHAGPTWFFNGWLAELPLPEGATLVLLDANTVDTGVWLSAEYTAPADQFDALVQFYAQDHTSGALELDATSLPDDLSALDYFTAGFFPTLAGFTIFATVERDFTQPDADVIVRLSVRVES